MRGLIVKGRGAPHPPGLFDLACEWSGFPYVLRGGKRDRWHSAHGALSQRGLLVRCALAASSMSRSR